MNPTKGLARGAVMSAFLGLSCQPQSQPETPLPPSPHETPTLHELLPLKDNTVSSFEMSSDLGDEGLLMLEIFRPRADLAELKIAGRVQRVVVEDTRISQLTGGILLEEPLEKGHTFAGPFGKTTITNTRAQVKLPAGSFDNCVTTVEESTRPPKRATSTYCRQVGLVHLIVETFGADGIRLETRLRHHGPRVDLKL